LSTRQHGQLRQRNGLERLGRRHQLLPGPAELSEGRGDPEQAPCVRSPTSPTTPRPDRRMPCTIPGLRRLGAGVRHQRRGTAVAALVAIADQGRALNGQGSLNGATQTLPALYQLPSTDFHDITTGSNGAYSATTGYDLVTGLGTPVANQVVSGLVSYGSSGQSPNQPPAGGHPGQRYPHAGHGHHDALERPGQRQRRRGRPELHLVGPQQAVRGAGADLQRQRHQFRPETPPPPSTRRVTTPSWRRSRTPPA